MGPTNKRNKNSKKTQGKRSTSREDERDRPREREMGGDREAGGGSSGFKFTDRTGKVHTLERRATDKPSQGRQGRVIIAPRDAREPGAGNEPEPQDFSGFRGRRGPKKEERPVKSFPESGITTRRHRSSATTSSPAATKETGRGRGGPGKSSLELIRLKATVDKNRKGFGFLSFENRQYEDAFVPPREAETLFHGDRVQVTISGRGEVHKIEVLEHRFREMVGRFAPHPSGPARGGWVIYERKKAREEVFIPEMKQMPVEGDWLRVKLQFHESGQHRVTAEILEIYGQELPASADVGMIANEYNLVEEHPADSEREALEQKLDVPGKDLQGREDLRDVPFITIDGETARDFDDAIHVERARGGGYVLWVAIADVSHYVLEGNALDRDARSRGTSVYFPERAFHMLPRALSENLCSLRPNEPRLSMVARMDYDSSGNRVATELMEAVIQSKRRATYNEIAAEWDANRSNPKWEFEGHFALYQLIRKSRNDRGSIDFDFPEAEILCEKNGEVTSIKSRARVDSHRLIEEFMIAANEAVTDWALARDWPFVYRVHDVPSMQALEKFQTLAANVGVSFVIGDASPKVMADLVKSIVGHQASSLLNTALLRSMKQAIYSSTHGIHFGLASAGYTHFTSPIRRYPDLVVHRLLRHALRVDKGLEPKLNETARQKIENDLVDITEHCSYRERLASDAERESIKLKQVRLMMRHLGDEFDGKVNGMTENGLFIQLDDPFVEGMIPKDSMTDDFYQFNDERMVFYGKRTKRTFQMGDRVRVNVVRADIDRRMIDFGLIGGGTTGLDIPPPAKIPGGGKSGGGRRDGQRGGQRDSGKRGGGGGWAGGRGHGGGVTGPGGGSRGAKATPGRFASPGANQGDAGLGRGDQRGFQGEGDRPRKGKRAGKNKPPRRKR